VVTVIGAAGCARLGGELVNGRQLSQAFRTSRTAEGVSSHADEVQLTSATLPRLAFATADTPVDLLLKEGDRPLPMNGLCPADMASVDDLFCVDKYEAALVEVLPSGQEQAWPYYLPIEGHAVRAVSEKGVYPQGYISGKQAASACKASGKRLCKPAEWKTACKGPEKQQFGYGNEHKPGTCNDQGKSGMGMLYGHEIAQGKGFVWHNMNDPQLNQLAGTLAETGSHEGCTNGYGIHDMVGNLHEWVDDPAGTFQGGYYLDVRQNGDGCGYRTDAHEAWYHDYSTGFRCCSDVAQ
jgi:formylglycine-generating enzyme